VWPVHLTKRKKIKKVETLHWQSRCLPKPPTLSDQNTVWHGGCFRAIFISFRFHWNRLSGCRDVRGQNSHCLIILASGLYNSLNYYPYSRYFPSSYHLSAFNLHIAGDIYGLVLLLHIFSSIKIVQCLISSCNWNCFLHITSWVALQCTTQFAVAVTGHSTLSSDEMRSAEMMSFEVRWG